jgi:hypothetical protein
VGSVELVAVDFRTNYNAAVTVQACSTSSSWLAIVTTMPINVNGPSTFRLRLDPASVFSEDHSPLTSQMISGCLIFTASGGAHYTSQNITVNMIIRAQCKAGTTSSSGTNYPTACAKCAFGTYSANLTTCRSCPAETPRTLSDGANSSALCVPCPLGRFCPVGSPQPVECPYSGGYETLAGGQGIDDSSGLTCEAVPCQETYWCGAGAAEGSTYRKVLNVGSIFGSTVIKQIKTFEFEIQNLDSSSDLRIFSAAKGALWWSLGSPEFIAKAGSTSRIPLTIDASFFESGRINDTIPLQWEFSFSGHANEGTTFAVSVQVDITIYSLTLSPDRFDYLVLSSAITDLQPPIPPVIQVFNTLCNNGLEIQVASVSCDGSPHPLWLTFTGADPFGRRQLDVQSGVPLDIGFAVDASVLPLVPFGELNREGTSAAPRFTTCAQINITIVGLGDVIMGSVDIKLRQARLCPPGTYSGSGTDAEGCVPCVRDTYQDTEGKTFCERCPDASPRTRLQGSATLGECLSDRNSLLNNGMRVDCPIGANCSEIGLTTETLPVRPGYWRTTPQSLTLMACPNPKVSAQPREPVCTQVAAALVPNELGRRLPGFD